MSGSAMMAVNFMSNLKKQKEKKKPLQMFLGMECSERLFLLQSEEIATFAREQSNLRI